MPGVARDTSRLTALLVKELGYKLQVPVVDGYSQELLDFGGGQGFTGFFSTPDGQATLSSPNNRGRVWLCRLLEKTIDDLAAYAQEAQSTGVTSADEPAEPKGESE